MSKSNQKNIESIDKMISELLNISTTTGDKKVLDEIERLSELRRTLTQSHSEESVGKVTGDQTVRSIVTIGGLIGVIGFEQFGGIITSKAFSLLKGLGGGA